MSPIMQVLIGLVFLYSLLAILVTQINSVIANTLRLRTQHLRNAIGELIQDQELYAKVISHPLIRMVEGEMLLPGQQISDTQAQNIINGTLKNIGKIQPDTFVNVLMSLIRVTSDKELFGALLDIIDKMPDGEDRRRLRLAINRIMNTGEGIRDLMDLVNQIGEKPYREALTTALANIASEIADMGLEPNNNIALIAGLRTIKNPYLRNALSTVLATSRTLEDTEQQLVQWFNNGLERADAAYKRSMHMWSLIIGAIIAIVLNVDTLFLAQELWYDQTLRDSVVAVASSTDIATLEAINATAEADITSTDDTSTEDVVSSAEAVGQTLDNIIGLSLPMGWNFEDLSDAPENDQRIGNARYAWNLVPGNYDGWIIFIIAKIIGLAATMTAIAQGAPFWFGILKRLSGGASSST